jgi:predicted transcriptional regulator
MKRQQFSRREREIMDIIFNMGEATANEVLEKMPSPPSYSAVRAMLRILENKGHLRHEQDGTRYLYKPTMTTEKAGKSALNHLLSTFFDGSATKVVSTLLDDPQQAFSEDDLDALAALIERARKEGR